LHGSLQHATTDVPIHPSTGLAAYGPHPPNNKPSDTCPCPQHPRRCGGAASFLSLFNSVGCPLRQLPRRSALLAVASATWKAMRQMHPILHVRCASHKLCGPGKHGVVVWRFKKVLLSAPYHHKPRAMVCHGCCFKTPPTQGPLTGRRALENRSTSFRLGSAGMNLLSSFRCCMRYFRSLL
jgi:hypothetical protein